MNLTDELRAEYIRLFEECQIRPDEQDDDYPVTLRDVIAFCGHIYLDADARVRYEEVQKKTGVPWFVVALIHGLECSFSFKQHLHNGDSLNHRTVNVPAGRPKTGSPPFDWVFSAVDAIEYDRLEQWTDWTVAGICYKLESYNGWGYRGHGINSPYLWSGSNNYERGKYVADGHWDSKAVSKQVGAIVALKWMVENHVTNLKAILNL
jgi:lysozyme family protein